MQMLYVALNFLLKKLRHMHSSDKGTDLGNPISATRPWPNFVTSKPSPAPLEPWFIDSKRSLKKKEK